VPCGCVALWLSQPTEGNTRGTHSGLTAQLKYDITTSRCQVVSRCQIYQTKDYKKGQAYYPAGREPIEIKIIEGDK